MRRIVFMNIAVKRTSIYVVVFAITCILMGGAFQLSGPSRIDEAAFIAGQAVIQTLTSHIETEPRMRQTLFPISGEYPSPHQTPVFQSENTLDELMPDEMILPTADGFVYSDNIPLSYELQKYTYDRCVEKGLEYELILALMWRESRFQIDAVGYNTNGTTDSGIMQINDVNRGWLEERHGIVDLMDPIQNIDAGTIMLSNFTKKYGLYSGLMAYQYGESGMLKKMEEGVYTNDKVAILLEKREDFREILQ